MLDVSASYDEATGAGGVFIVNRSETETLTTELIWQSAVPQQISEAWQLAGTDVKAVNSWEQPNNITARPIKVAALSDGKVTLSLPPLSFTALSVK